MASAVPGPSVSAISAAAVAIIPSSTIVSPSRRASRKNPAMATISKPPTSAIAPRGFSARLRGRPAQPTARRRVACVPGWRRRHPRRGRPPGRGGRRPGARPGTTPRSCCRCPSRRPPRGASRRHGPAAPARRRPQCPLELGDAHRRPPGEVAGPVPDLSHLVARTAAGAAPIASRRRPGPIQRRTAAASAAQAAPPRTIERIITAGDRGGPGRHSLVNHAVVGHEDDDPPRPGAWRERPLDGAEPIGQILEPSEAARRLGQAIEMAAIASRCDEV